MNVRFWSLFVGSLVFALCLGIMSISFFLSHDQAFKKVVEERIKKIFLYSFKGEFKGSLKSIDLLSGEIELENVTVSSPNSNDTWQWKADTFTLQFSWLSYLFTKKFTIKVFLHNLESHSKMVGSSIAIIDHLQSFIAAAAGFPATLKMLSISKGHFTLFNSAHAITYSTSFNGTYGNINGWLRVNLTTSKGKAMYATHQLFDNFNGTLSVSVPTIHTNGFSATASGNILIPELSDNPCHLDGQWHSGKGHFFLHTADNRYAITLYNWNQIAAGYDGDISITVPFGYLVDYCATLIPALQKINLKGTAHCQAHCAVTPNAALHSEITVHDITYNEQKLGTMAFELFCKDGGWQLIANHFYSHHTTSDIHGIFTYQEQSHIGGGKITTTTPLVLPNGWKLTNATITTDIQNNGIEGAYTATLEDLPHKNSLLVDGTFNANETSITSSGTCNTKKFHIVVGTQPSCMIEQCTLYEKPEKMLLQFSSTNSKTLQGVVDLELIQELSQMLLRHKISGQGNFIFNGVLEDSVVKISLKMHEGNIRIPETYTLIRDITATTEIDIPNKKIVVRDGTLHLDKGSIRCNQAVISCDSSGMPIHMHIPCIINKAFFTVNKELFVVVSGSLLWTCKAGKEPLLEGKLILDRGYCKKNIFSQVEGGNANKLSLGSGSQHFLMNLGIETKNPLDIKTSFLETKVHIDCSLQGHLHNPELSGSINLENGTLAFPYRPLTITHGTIYFLPHQLFDPNIELVAKGKLRKYQVTLRCNGSLQHPHISFESTPALTEEQIITLLLAGSEEGSLSLAMPALIMQRVQNVIFGPEQSALKLEGYFKSLLAPFKHIRFIPGFSDQSGRGGFRGSIEIDVNDQLRAMIQKNFSLTEDIKVEVEYFLSDDITIRGIRDERTDLGGEIEMRWKF